MDNETLSWTLNIFFWQELRTWT